MAQPLVGAPPDVAAALERLKKSSAVRPGRTLPASFYTGGSRAAATVPERATSTLLCS